MKRFGFYIVGKKGFDCLSAFVEEFGSLYVSFVVSSRDINVKNDYFQDIKYFCEANDVFFSDRLSLNKRESSLSFAIGWRWLIHDDDNLVVFHDSILPRYRGFAPLVNALINGEKNIGVTALRADSKYDAGNIIGQNSIEVIYPKKIADAIDEITKLYIRLLLDISRKTINGESLLYIEQDHSKASFSPWRDEDDYSINWSKSAEYISRFIDAVGYPYLGAKSRINGEDILINDSIALNDVFVEDRSSHIGKIIFMTEGRPTIICGEGLIELIDVVNSKGESLIGKIPFRTRFGS
ncbi:hypothetical protein KQ940_15285 [Marinobacterium sp. D7]|uniref:formyltransferase family protein n=1 Tax=Marinobacterium ramblicola TaxID=2849041 RepID=UPI001C2D93DA|nr:formyltransferase family protein [Marinobacterium ramblicola]MBV1789418.1 hypothetical protein [Marinobacterium ramblicola]